VNRAPSLLRRPAALLAAVALAVVVVALAFRWWDRYVEDQLGRWAVAELARRSGGAYRLVLGDLSFRPLAGSISFDSAIVATDTARNRRRETPLPTLEGRAQGCRVSGIDLLQLLVRRSFAAHELGCDRVVSRIAIASPPREKHRPPSDSAPPAVRLEKLARPLGLSSFRIAEVSLPALGFTLTRPGARGGTSLLLEHARFEGKDLVFDPTANPRERASLSADRARLRATRLVLRPDTLIEIAIAGVEASLTDSTLRLAGARHEPSIPEDEWVRRVRVRRDRIRFVVDSLRARGVAYRAFVATGDIAIRDLELDGARLDVLTDKRIPGRPSRHRTPQQVAASPGRPLRLDSVIINRGTIVYRERKPGRERPGWVSFDSVRATILNLHLPPRGKPLRIVASARLMNQGLLAVEASVPLDAPDFRYELSGRLGRMPAMVFNRFLAENEPFKLDDGWVEGITFRQTARGGRATTIVTPRYRDLSVEPSGDVADLKEFVADAFMVRSRNPDKDGDNLRTARAVRRYDPSKSWSQFIWVGLRDALTEALKE
jgi:hypothetical protein